MVLLLYACITPCRCSNADPNFGAAWFYCREHPSSIPGSVLRSAANLIKHDIVAASKSYTRAVLRYVLCKVLTAAPTHSELWKELCVKYSKWSCFTENDGILSGADFLSAFRSMNQVKPFDHMSYDEKYKILFKGDPIVP